MFHSIYDPTIKKVVDTYGKFSKTKQIKKTLENILSCCSHYDGESTVADFSKKDLENLVFWSEKIALSCREAMEEQEIKNEIIPNFSNRNSSENLPLSINFTDEILEINCPFTFTSTSKYHGVQMYYQFPEYVRIALMRYQYENNIEFSDYIKPPYTTCIIRKSKTFSLQKFCDNDNMENKRIINHIASVLKTTDNANTMDLMSCFRTVTENEKTGTTFLVFSNKLDKISVIKQWEAKHNLIL